MKAKDLKNSILQMAVQGKLVPQDPNDEPASILLERIRAERAKLVKEKKIKAPKGGDSVIYRASDGSHYEKRGKGKPVCIDDEIPFEIPESWEWVRLGSLCSKVGSGSTPPGGRSVYKSTGAMLIRSQNVYNDGLHLDNVVHFDQALFEKRGSNVLPNDILLNITGASIGRCAIVSPVLGDADVNQHVLILRQLDISLLAYVHLVITSPVVQTAIMDVQVGATKEGLSATKASSLLIPMAPPQEQRRIVSKVEFLLNRITDYDALEASRERLDDELPGRLRKSIIQQAVQGRLVAQDPSDEPASALLKRIRSERAKLVKEKKIKAPKGGDSVIYRASDGGYYEKRGKGEPVCIDNEIPFEIPDSWEWVRLESIMSLSSGLGYKKPDLDVRSQRMIRVLRGGNISQADTIVLQDSDVFIADQFVDPNLMLLPGQIITPAVTSLENVGKAALVRTGIPNTVCGGFVFFLMPLIDDMRLSRYLHIWLTSPEHRAYCKASVKKSGQAFYNLSKVSLNNALIAVPPLLEQERIVTICERLLD